MNDVWTQGWVLAVAGGMMGVATTPHCLVMCGPLMAASCGAGDRAEFRSLGVGRMAGYQLARTLTYGVLGGVGAAAGAWVLPAWLVSAPPWALSALVSWSLGPWLWWLAWRSWRATAGPRAPVVPLMVRRPDGSRRLASRIHAGMLASLGLGVVTGLLPCGALYLALLVAAGTGNVLTGAVMMIAFALGSGVFALAAVGLLASSPLSRWWSRAWSLAWVRQTTALTLLVVGVVLVVRPIRLLQHQAAHPLALSAGVPAVVAADAPHCH